MQARDDWGGFVYDEERHLYWNDGEIVRSITGILSDAGYVDYSAVAPDVLEFAADRGKEAHFACYLDDLGDLLDETVDPRVLPYLKGYRRFKEQSGWEVLNEHSEAPRLSLRHNFAGTPDRAMRKPNGRIAVVELKCIYTHQPSVGPQTAAQQILLEEAGVEIHERYSLQLHPRLSLGFKLHTLKDDGDRAAFLAAKDDPDGPVASAWRRKHGKGN